VARAKILAAMVAGAITIGSAHAEQWTLVHSDPQQISYAAFPSIVRTGDTLIIPVLINYIPPLPFGDTGKYFGSLVQWVKYDCAAPRWQLGPSILYAGNSGSGDVIDRGDDWTKWFSVPEYGHEVTMPEVRKIACPENIVSTPAAPAPVDSALYMLIYCITLPNGTELGCKVQQGMGPWYSLEHCQAAKERYRLHDVNKPNGRITYSCAEKTPEWTVK
jgi:hypothetical protein